MFKILGAKNRRKNLQKYPGPTFQIRPGPGYFSRAQNSLINQEFLGAGSMMEGIVSRPSLPWQKFENSDDLAVIQPESIPTKGQLISKCPFGVFKLTKKPTKFL